MGERKFRTSMFGYNKKDVYNFIETLTDDFEREINSKDTKIEELKLEIQELKKQINDYNDHLSDIEKERSYISDAIIKAEKQAKDIIEKAVEESNKKKHEIMLKIEEEKVKFNKLKDELNDLKMNAINAMKKYQSQLEESIKEKKNSISKMFDKEFADDAEEIEAEINKSMGHIEDNTDDNNED